MVTRRPISRLARKQRASNLRLTIILSLLTAGILAGLVWAGIPLVVKILGWIGDYNVIENTVTNNDTTPPPTPRLIIASSTTKDHLLSVKGYAEPGAKVSLYTNGQLAKEVVSETNGQFLATDLILKPGENEIYVIATDSAGNTSAESAKEKVVYDNKPPVLTIDSPTDGAEVKGDSNLLEVRGKTEIDSRVWINDRLVIMGAEGAFTHSMSLTEGDQVVQVKAVDPAGNETIEEITVTYTP